MVKCLLFGSYKVIRHNFDGFPLNENRFFSDAIIALQISKVTFRWLRCRRGAFTVTQTKFHPLLRMHRVSCGVDL
jgi:hypothetical protein